MIVYAMTQKSLKILHFANLTIITPAFEIGTYSLVVIVKNVMTIGGLNRQYFDLSKSF